MLKVMTVLGTRPEIIKMSCVIKKFDLYTENKVVFTGQNFSPTLSKVFFKDLDIREPDYSLNVNAKNSSIQVSNIIKEVDKVLEIEDPDAFLIYGDTNSCISSYCAKRRKIPIFHFEAGNRCMDVRVPEEINRKIIDHLSDYNFVLSEHSRRNLISEGIPENRIIKTGSHLTEVIKEYESFIKKTTILEKLDLNEKNYLLFSFHREENVDDINLLKKLLKQILKIEKFFNQKIIISTHPRTKNNLSKISKDLEKDYKQKNIYFMEPLGYFDYLTLQKKSTCTISDSGTITEEASILGFPAVMLRRAHERFEGEDAALLIKSNIESEDLLEKIRLIINLKKSHKKNYIKDYTNENVSDQVLMTVLSHVSTVNHYTWFKK